MISSWSFASTAACLLQAEVEEPGTFLVRYFTGDGASWYAWGSANGQKSQGGETDKVRLACQVVRVAIGTKRVQYAARSLFAVLSRCCSCIGLDRRRMLGNRHARAVQRAERVPLPAKTCHETSQRSNNAIVVPAFPAPFNSIHNDNSTLTYTYIHTSS